MFLYLSTVKYILYIIAVPYVVQSAHKVFVNCEKKNINEGMVTFANPIDSYFPTDCKENNENLNTEGEMFRFKNLSIGSIDKWFRTNQEYNKTAHNSQNHVICSD